MRQALRPTGFARAQFLAASIAACAAGLALGLIAAAHVLPVAPWAAAADMVTPLTGHILVGTAAAVVALVARRWQLAILALSVAVALLGHMAYARWHRSTQLWPLIEARGAGAGLRIYALNSWDENPDLKRLEAALAAVGADVIVLTEADPSKLAMLERLKVSYPHQVSCADVEICATAILSRLPIVAGLAARAAYLVPPVAWARIDTGERGLGVVTVIGTHVHRPTRDPWVHARQMRALAQMIVQTKGPVVVAGDFNVGGWSASFGEFIGLTGLKPFESRLPTWPAYPLEMPQVALDHILVTPDLAVTRGGVGPATGSDHLPVFAEIKAGVARVSAK